MKKLNIALAVGATLLAGCGTLNSQTSAVSPMDVKIATYNLSFDRATFQELVAEMQIPPAQQTKLVTGYLANVLSPADRKAAKKVIQIRNVAAIIQKNRPDVLMMAEFNNDGTGKNKSALIGFQNNYLSVGQSLQGAGGEASLSPIEYPFFESYSTNTGLVSELDLDNNGVAGQLPGDAWGFGFYHGQYAFALMSKYPIDTDNTRTFQQFKWKDLPGASIPKITKCHDPYNKIPQGMACGDDWYSAKEWQQIRLSSKNHVDAPIIVPTANGDQVIHLLMSHPTPPVFDTGKNQMQNAAEVEFWHHYVQDADFFYDDAGKQGGLDKGQHFVIMGDLNLDPVAGDGLSNVMQALHSDPLLNQNVMNGSLYPTSEGAIEHIESSGKSHPQPERVTSTFGLGVDYAMPSATLNVVDSGVYWVTSQQEGYSLFNDQRVGKYGNGKDVSSDHRMIWIKASLD